MAETLLLVCSDADQVAEIHRLSGWWSSRQRVWIAPESAGTRRLLENEAWQTYRPTEFTSAARSVLRVVRRHRDALVVVDTGSLGALAALTGRLGRRPVMAIEGTAQPSHSWSRRLVGFLADVVLSPHAVGGEAPHAVRIRRIL